jgi:hypothetical protein
MGEEVGAIGGDLEIEDDIGGEEVGERAADWSIRRENEEAFVAFAEAELFGAAHHALAFDAAEFADLDLEVAGKHGAGESEGDLVADPVIFRSADDLVGLVPAGAYLADAEAVGIRMLDGIEYLGDDDVWDIGATFLDSLDLDAGEGEEVDESLRGGGRGDELAEPAQ